MTSFKASILPAGVLRGLGVLVLALAGSSLQGLQPAAAQGISDATRLGSFAGAMRYCEDRYGGNERRFRRSRLRVAEAVDRLDRGERLRALAARDRSYDRGQFLGKPLDSRSCRELLKISEWKAFTD